MNKKAAMPSILQSNVIYVLFTGLFVIGIFMAIYYYRDNANTWEEIYAKEIARMINLAEPGDIIAIDIHKGSLVARKQGFNEYSSIISFDNPRREIVVKLRKLGETRFSYVNNVLIENVSIELGVPTNVLHFRVVAPTESNWGGK
jgi:hypothetical protein